MDNKSKPYDPDKTLNLDTEPSVSPYGPNPGDCLEMINTYGTYEIQPTANSENDYPAISQGEPSDPEKRTPSIDKYGSPPRW